MLTLYFAISIQIRYLRSIFQLLSRVFATLHMSFRRGTDVLAILLKSDPSFGCFKKNLGKNFSQIRRCIVLQEKLIMVGPPIGVPSVIQKFVSLVRMVFRFEEEPFLSLPVSRHQNLIFQLF